jgi:hypothetical protein
MTNNYLNLKAFTCFLLFIFSTGLCAQETELSDYEEISLKMSQIDKALIEKDTAALAYILHKDLTLGHSNGWIETKNDLLETLITEGVTYLNINNAESFTIHHTSENLISTRRKIDVNGLLNATPFEVKLNVLEVWICENESWQLLARQSVNRKD